MRIFNRMHVKPFLIQILPTDSNSYEKPALAMACLDVALWISAVRPNGGGGRQQRLGGGPKLG